ncbi:MAG TPA: PLP-dependent aminotransferase family protein, partial [Vicinamibacteria bacterium]
MGRGVAAELAGVALDPTGPAPLYRQLYDGIRAAILAGQLRAGTRLPATRDLAARLGVARLTVQTAFDQLAAEGYLEGRRGSGTYVAGTLPDALLEVRAGGGRPVAAGEHRRASPAHLAGHGRGFAAIMQREGTPRPLQFGLPALDAFPTDLLARLAARRWRWAPPAFLGYGDSAGFGPLRDALADYLGAARGVRCTPEQVLIVAGAQQGLSLIARALLAPGDAAWVEDPGYGGARAALAGAGAAISPVPVDAEGLDVAAGVARHPAARAVYVTPSYQFPLGVTMSLRRRLALLDWADRAGAWVIEDDYDSEYRYVGRPLPALQGLDTRGRVIYVGSLSKVLVPALHLGYLVVPPDLVAALRDAHASAGRQVAAVDQAVVADFIAAGHFGRHIRRMRALYQERQRVLVAAAGEQLRGLLEVRPAAAGMHLVGRLPEEIDDRVAARRAERRGVRAAPLSAFSLGATGERGLLLGYAAYSAGQIRATVGRLAVALREVAGAGGGRLAEGEAPPQVDPPSRP